MQVALQFVTEKWDPVSALIRFETRCDYSHVNFRLADGTLLGSLIDGGVEVRPANYANWSKVYLATAPGIERAADWALRQVGKKYDWKALVGIASDTQWQDKDKFICSELVAAAFEATGSPLLNPNALAWRITPRDLLLSPFLKELEAD